MASENKKKNIENLEKQLELDDEQKAKQSTIEFNRQQNARNDRLLTKDEHRNLTNLFNPSSTSPSSSETRTPVMNRCSSCNTLPFEPKRRCRKCGEFAYCSIGCEKTHAPTHAQLCKIMTQQYRLQDNIVKDWLSEVPGREDAVVHYFCALRPNPTSAEIDPRDVIPRINAMTTDADFSNADKSNEKLVKTIKYRIDQDRWYGGLGDMKTLGLTQSRQFYTRDRNRSIFFILFRQNHQCLFEIKTDFDINEQSGQKFCHCKMCDPDRTETSALWRGPPLESASSASSSSSSPSIPKISSIEEMD